MRSSERHSNNNLPSDHFRAMYMSLSNMGLFAFEAKAVGLLQIWGITEQLDMELS